MKGRWASGRELPLLARSLRKHAACRRESNCDDDLRNGHQVPLPSRLTANVGVEGGLKSVALRQPRGIIVLRFGNDKP